MSLSDPRELETPHAYRLRRPVENAYIVRERDRRLLRELLSVLLTVAMVGGGLLGYTWIHVEVLRQGYQVHELGRELQRLQSIEQELQLEVAERSRPDLLEKRAREELGMTLPNLEETAFYQEYLP